MEQRANAVENLLVIALEDLNEAIAITDAEDRIVYVNRGFREINASVAGHLEPGKRYEEHLRAGIALGNYPDASGREEEWIAARLALRRNPSGPVERPRQDGKWLLVTDQRLPDGGVITVGLDITERKRAERTSRLEHEVTRLLADAATALEGLEAAMRALCAAEGWDLAEYWAVDRATAALRRSAHWVSPEWPAARDFADRSAGLSFRPGEGLPGSVWQTAEPLWIPDLQREPRMLRTDLARETGMGGALLVPVLAANQLVGVLMFVSREIRAPDAWLQQALASIGHQIGQLLRRRRAEERLRANEQRLSALVSSALEAIIIADAGQRVLAFNPAAEAIFGLRAQEVLGAPLERLIPERFRDAHRGRMERYAAAGASSRRMGEAGRVSGLRADGSEFPAEAAIAQFAVGEERFFTVMLRDVTEQVRIDRELRDLNANLETRVAERTAELESFSYTVSHDLRAPARAMAGFARIVHDDFGPQLPEEARRLLLRIAKAGTDMGAMVDGLLELTRISRGELERRPVHLGALAAEVWRDLAAAEPGRTVEFHMSDGGIRSEGDPVLLRNLLLNLMSNARKYTRGRSDAAVWFGRTPGGEYFVRDNGVGFDMAHAGKLFGEFQRLHSEREFEGHGIGLALARRIVERHGGRIRAEGVPGKGAAFFFTLP